MSMQRSTSRRMMPGFGSRGLAALVALGAVAVALAAAGGLDAGKSTLTATFRQENVPVDVPFRRFSGQISFDAAHPSAATAAIDVETGSFDIGDESYNAEVRKPAWFDSTKFPRATFRSSAVKAGSAGQLEATGALTIKGRVTTITVPISVQRSGRQSTYAGSFVISRGAYGIGDPTWNDVVDDKVTLHFSLVSTDP